MPRAPIKNKIKSEYDLRGCMHAVFFAQIRSSRIFGRFRNCEKLPLADRTNTAHLFRDARIELADQIRSTVADDSRPKFKSTFDLVLSCRPGSLPGFHQADSLNYKIPRNRRKYCELRSPPQTKYVSRNGCLQLRGSSRWGQSESSLASQKTRENYCAARVCSPRQILRIFGSSLLSMAPLLTHRQAHTGAILV